jgi:hypothetical protein
MPCARCQAELSEVPPRPAVRAPFGIDSLGAQRWCDRCERSYDTWSRNHASDIIWSVLGGMVVVLTGAIVVPLLGVPWVWATTSIIGGSAAILGIHRWNRRRRRTQFLKGAAMPRAYLPEKT